MEINTTLTKSLVDNPGELEDLIKFAKSIKADLKIIELFPNTDKENFIPIETLVPLLEKMNYKFKGSEFRKTIYDDNENTISLIKCTCSEVSCYSDKKSCVEIIMIYIFLWMVIYIYVDLMIM